MPEQEEEVKIDEVVENEDTKVEEVEIEDTKSDDEIKDDKLPKTKEELEQLIKTEKQKAVDATLARNKKKEPKKEVEPDTEVQDRLKEVEAKLEEADNRMLSASLNYALSNNNLPKKASALLLPLLNVDKEDYSNQEVIDNRVKELLEEHDYIKVGMQNTNKPNTEEIQKEKTQLEKSLEYLENK